MKILIGYDGSECSDAAIIDLKRAGLPSVAEASVLTVAEVSSHFAHAPVLAMVGGLDSRQPDDVAIDAPRGQPLEAAQGFAQLAADRLRADFPGWHINTESWVDEAGPAIIRKAHAWSPDLIVVGSHGRSVLGRLVHGSVSHSVLGAVNCSVRIGRHHLHSQERSIRLLIGMNISTAAWNSVHAVSARIWPPGTEARVIGLMDCRWVDASPFCVTEEALPSAIEEKWRDELSEILHKAVHELKQAGLQAVPQIYPGEPGQILLNEAERWGADCIFLGAETLDGDLFVPRRVSVTVATHAHCSVEIIRPDHPTSSFA
jgi:nucleotide-binding universal stress UspA family protein